MFRIVFFGTSEFAVPALAALRKDGRFDILGIVTQPDRPVGRHATLTSPPVAVAAADMGLTAIFQPEKLHDEPFNAWIRDIGPSCDAFVVIAYGNILPQWVLDLPKKGIVNVHGSLLPRWRGPSPIHAAIAAGDAKTGVTIMNIDAKMDHGPILARFEEDIRSDDTTPALHDRLALRGASELPDVLAAYLDGKIEPKEQDHSTATYCRILTREDGRIDPASKTAQELERLIRAYTPWPGTFLERHGKRLKILAARVVDANVGLTIPCANETLLELATVQPENGKPMSGADFLRGH